MQLLSIYKNKIPDGSKLGKETGKFLEHDIFKSLTASHTRKEKTAKDWEV